MTIVASVKVYDGIVLGADSATQILAENREGKVGVIKTYQNAKKLFQLCDLPIGILTYGIGNIGPKSIETVLREFDPGGSFKLTNLKIKEVTQKLYTFLKNAYNGAFSKLKEKPILGFYVAGYSKDSPLGEEWEFRFPGIPVKKVREKNIFGASWRGISIPFSRLYYGFDSRLNDDFLKLGVPQDKITELSRKLRSPVIYDGMPLKEAIKFVKFILSTTIGLSYFQIGPQSCSEPIRIASIQPDRGFELVEDF